MSFKSFVKLHSDICGQRWGLVPTYFDYMKSNYYKGKNDRPWSIIVDIDGTIQSDSSAAHEIYPNVAESLAKLVASNVHICFVTARTDHSRIETIDELKNLNLSKEHYTLLMKKSQSEPISTFKTRCRAKMREKYYIPILLGDQLHDLSEHDEAAEDEPCLNILIENPFSVL